MKHTPLWRTKDGYFAGSNFPSDPKLIKEETTFDTGDGSSSMNARHARWDQLMQQNKGRIDAKLAQQFLADHYDVGILPKKRAQHRRERQPRANVYLHLRDPFQPQFDWIFDTADMFCSRIAFS